MMEPQEFQSKLRGVHSVLFTPFKPKTYEIDYEAIGSNLPHVLKAGVRILLTTG